MDDTDSNQEADAHSSSEETTSFERYAYSRELFESSSSSFSEEDERDILVESLFRPRSRSLEDEHFIAVRYPLPSGSVSLSLESETESPVIMAGAPPTRAEYEALLNQVTALTALVTAHSYSQGIVRCHC